MKYLGGKSRLGRKIVEVIKPWRVPNSIFVDAFCGTLNVVRWAKTPRVALDLCQPLITTLQAVQRGWEPPELVTPETYARIKTNPDPWDPLTGFVMFGCTYSGMWGTPLTKPYQNNSRGAWYDPVKQAVNGLKTKLQACQDVTIGYLDYRKIPAPPQGTVIYADIPYHGTTNYTAVPKFNSAEFWTWADWWHRCGALVFVSEGANARNPESWTIIQTWSLPTYLGGGGKAPREARLYVHRDSPMTLSMAHV